MKLTKAELRLQHQVQQLLFNNREKLTFSDREFIYKNFHPGYISDIAKDSAYFTPLDMAYDFGLFCGRYGVCVDMCAGIGILTFAARTRDHYDKKIKHSICIERNERFAEIGKKLVPKAEWIVGDIFDKSIWDYIIDKYGKINCIYSNPPFGKVSKTDCDRSWLKYQGSEIDMAAIEIALSMVPKTPYVGKRVSMILPQGSTTFQYSGRPYYKEVDNRKVNKLIKESGIDFYMSNPGIDCSVYSDFKGTKINVEYVDFEIKTKKAKS
ncbi:MAG: hypothetical protein EOO06_00320 [Chitinophagaceae bacterium]|nr:MAG: hypothetical protein EOO06_00320 [Chitinophagaceae bacterium]